MAVLEAKLNNTLAAVNIEATAFLSQREVVAVQKQCLEMAIIDVCNVANRRVSILSVKNIRQACDYLTMGDR